MAGRVTRRAAQRHTFQGYQCERFNMGIFSAIPITLTVFTRCRYYNCMQLQSKFKPWVIYLSGLFVLFAGLFVFLVFLFFRTPQLSSLSIMLVLLIPAFFLVWIFVGELRTKAIKVTIEVNTITATSYLGFGRRKSFTLSEFDGFKTSILPSEYEDYEFLYLMSGNKKLVKLSQFYHQNYPQLKKAIAGKLKHLGHEKFRFVDELKEIFV